MKKSAYTSVVHQRVDPPIRCACVRRLPDRRMTPTNIVDAVGWFVGMLPATVVGNSAGRESFPEPSLLIILIFSAGFGAIAGGVSGFAQWLVLRPHTKHATVWMGVNAIGWSLARSANYIGASLPTAEWPLAFVVLDGTPAGIIAGLVIGAVTGAGLVRLLRDQT